MWAAVARAPTYAGGTGADLRGWQGRGRQPARATTYTGVWCAGGGGGRLAALMKKSKKRITFFEKALAHRAKYGIMLIVN